MSAKCLTILGSTGSIGLQTLAVARHLKLEVASLAAHRSIDLLYEQIQEFNPKIVAVFDEKKAMELQKKVPGLRIVAGMEGLLEAACFSKSDLVVSAMTGSIGIIPTLAAIESKKNIALANKEVLVGAGELIMRRAKELGVKILPVDSEHSALFQCLEHKNPEEVRKLILTASGGPFFHFPQEKLETITVESALNHPSWKMGAKVTIDSSTLMNKGLEVIEAFHLFQRSLEEIEVVVHPQSVIHSMIEMRDGSLFAQMSEPSMIFPIQYAITWPERPAGFLPAFSFTKYPKLEFLPLEKGKFICLELAYEALKEGGSFPCYLNAANEVLVSRFLEEKISWLDIGKKLDALLSRHKKESPSTLEAIFAVDAAARREALTI
jgi:1-deoxy-D-xylulose-5-phosphate reductoisomerase